MRIFHTEIILQQELSIYCIMFIYYFMIEQKHFRSPPSLPMPRPPHAPWYFIWMNFLWKKNQKQIIWKLQEIISGTTSVHIHFNSRGPNSLINGNKYKFLTISCTSRGFSVPLLFFTTQRFLELILDKFWSRFHELISPNSLSISR